jgi:hypothetical protein
MVKRGVGVDVKVDDTGLLDGALGRLSAFVV